MTSRLGNSYRISIGKSGRPVVVEVRKRLNVCAELKRRTSKKVKVVRKVRP